MKIKFFGFQPISFTEETFIKVHTQKLKLPNNWFLSDKNCTLKDTDIISNIINMERHEVYYLDIDYDSIKQDFKYISNINHLQINSKETEFKIFYDLSYSIFFIIYKITLDIQELFKNEDLFGLYNQIRNELVIDPIKDSNLTISPWANDIRNIALANIEKILNTNCCMIKENSCYIFSSYEDFKLYKNHSAYKKRFIQENHTIDQIDDMNSKFANLSYVKLHSDKNNISLDLLDEENLDAPNLNKYYKSDIIFFLGWRFSTIYGIKNFEYDKFLSIFLNIQNIYIQINGIYKLYLSKLYDDVRFETDYNSLSKKMKLYDKLVVSIENLIFEKYKFVSKLKPYQVEIFELLEKYWGLDKDYDTLKQTMEICQTSLNRKMNIERNQIQEKQSNILFFLAVLQIFSLISVSVDFFNLPELKTATELKIYHNFFKENILNILIILSSILIIFAYYKPFRFKVKEWFSK